MKTFADDNLNVVHKMKFVISMVENNVGQGGNTGYHHFFHHMFLKGWHRVKEIIVFISVLYQTIPNDLKKKII